MARNEMFPFYIPGVGEILSESDIPRLPISLQRLWELRGNPQLIFNIWIDDSRTLDRNPFIDETLEIELTQRLRLLEAMYHPHDDGLGLHDPDRA